MKTLFYLWDMNETQTPNTMNISLTTSQLEDIKQTDTWVLIDICANCPVHLPMWEACNDELKNRLCK
jgi:hypothetical protein